MMNDMITLVSKWENRPHPPNPSGKKITVSGQLLFPICFV